MPITEKEQVDQLQELLRGQLSHFERTRGIEMKVNLGLWTAIVLAGGTLYQSGLRLDSAEAVVAYCFAAIVLWVAHTAFWMVPIQYSEDTDNFFINRYRRAIEAKCEILTEEAKPKFWDKAFWKRYRVFRETAWSWILAETGITLILCGLVGVVLAFAPLPK